MAGLNMVTMVTIGITLVWMIVTVVGSGHDDDIHGPIQMGIPDDHCDNGQFNIHVDYNKLVLHRVCRCMGKKNTHYAMSSEASAAEAVEECQPLQDPIHKCMTERINYGSDIPTSGAHRPLWPKFGEYLYLPPQRWIHSLEHGAIVFLYHPCADSNEIEKLKFIAYACLNKIIITPSTDLPPQYPFAVLSWGCKLLLPSINQDKITDFIRRKALTAPETHVPKEGQYDVGLLYGIGIGDMYEASRDDTICPPASKRQPPPVDAAERKTCRTTMTGAGLLRQRPTGSPRNKGDKGRRRKPAKDRTGGMRTENEQRVEMMKSLRKTS